MIASEDTDNEKYIHHLLFSDLTISINDCLMKKKHTNHCNTPLPITIDWTTSTTQLHNDYYERNWFSLE